MPDPFEISMYTAQYSTAFALLLQQKTSKIRGRISEAQYIGKMAQVVNQAAAVEFKAPAGRYSKINFQIPTFTRPWIMPVDRDVALPFDTWDSLKSVADPKGADQQNVVAAAARTFDDLIIAAAFGITQRGVDVGNLTGESFPSTASTTTSTTAPYGGFVVANTFGSGASSGLTVAKIREVKRVARHYHALDNESVCIAAGSQQESDLLGQTQVIDKDYNARPVFEDGEITRVLGVDFVWSERLQTESSNTLRDCIGWVPSGLHLGLWKDMSTKITEREDLSGHPWQLYSMISANAVRVELGRVYKIQCADTAGADITP